MDIKLVSSVTRLANYMPLGSYVIYTALETYSFSLGTTPAPVTTVVQTVAANYTCYYFPGAGFTYTTCTDDQSSALKISLSIGFFLAMLLSFLKQVPNNGTPPLADPPANNPVIEAETVSGGGVANLAEQRSQKRKYRRGIVYAEGNFYYLDFGDSHVWGHAALSFVAFGTLSLFSASVSQCLFPSVKPWIFVFTQIVLLVICCFIAMFWIDDPTLSIGLMVVPQTDSYPTQTSRGNVSSSAPGASAAAVTTYNASTSTTVLPSTATASGNPAALSSNGMAFALTSNPSRTSAGLANVALANNVMNSAMGMASTSAPSNTTIPVGSGGGVGRMSLQARQTTAMSSVNEKQDYVDQEDGREWYSAGVYEEEVVVSVLAPPSTTSSDFDAVEDEVSHLSLNME